jgi:hypothetical protein
MSDECLDENNIAYQIATGNSYRAIMLRHVVRAKKQPNRQRRHVADGKAE